MSSSNPIIPPGSPLQPRTNSHSKLLLAISAIVAVHMLILAGVLIQGCQRQDPLAGGAADSEFATNLPPIESSNAMPDPATADDTRALTPPPAESAGTTPPGSYVVTPPPLPQSSTGTAERRAPLPESSRAPTIVPQTSPEETAAATADAAAGSLVTYVVKSGDNLTRIAKAHKTTVQAIREANDLKTDRILVGQKLKVPQGSSASATGNGRGTSSPR